MQELEKLDAIRLAHLRAHERLQRLDRLIIGVGLGLSLLMVLLTIGIVVVAK